MSSRHLPLDRPAGRLVRFAAVACASLLVGGCGAGNPDLPLPRPIIVSSGATLEASKARLDSINTWVMREKDDIQNDPAFLVDSRRAPGEVYPWSYLSYGKDTVRVMVDPSYPSTELAFEIYAHLHLMARMGRQKEWLPEAPTATGFQLERAILARVADSWLLARAVYGATPYGPLDQILYAHEDGYLDPMILTAMPGRFAEARKTWEREHPDGMEKYRTWFEKTFGKAPPGSQ